MPIVISAEIEAVIQEFEHASDPFTVLDVQQALGKARRDLEQPSEADFGAWTECPYGRDQLCRPEPVGNILLSIGFDRRQGR